MDHTNHPTAQPTAPKRPRFDDHPGAYGGSKSTAGSTVSSSRIPTISQIDATGFSSGKGGGALRSIDQKFQVNPCNGTLALNLPLHVTSSRNDFHPELSLSYNSGAGNGPFGIGWNLSLGSVTRKTTLEIPRYTDADTFLLSGLDDLVKDGEQFSSSVSLGNYTVQRYRPRVESDERIRIEKFISVEDENDVFWRTISPNNVTSFYGRDDESRIMDKSESGLSRVFSWLLCEVYDPLGNAMLFSYKSENYDGICAPDGSLPVWETKRDPSVHTRARYLKSIKYGKVIPARDLESWQIVPVSERDSWMFEIVLDYGEHDLDKPTVSETRSWDVRKDASSTCSNGFEIRSYRLCRRVLLFHHFLGKLPIDDYLVCSYSFQYDEAPIGSLLSSLTSTGHVWNEETESYDSQSLAPYTFAYEKAPSLDSLQIKTMKPDCLQTLLVNQPKSQTRWVDLNGEGMSGLLVQLDGVWYYQRNENAINITTESGSDSEDSDIAEFMPDSPPDLGPVQIINSYPSVGDYSASYFEDLDGNGLQDLVLCDEKGRVNGYSECHSKDQWENITYFPSSLNMDASGGFIHRVDLTGNGRRDVLCSMGDGISWYQSLGKDGFDIERTCQGRDAIQMMLSKDQRSSLFFEDANGDGLADVLRISNGHISYCSNLGYGRFGAETVMGNPPLFDSEDQFSFDRLHLLDLDGSGTIDIVYIPPRGGAIAYFNLCGNAWSDGVPISRFPKLDHIASVFTLDLLGNGTSCLCWAAPDGATTSELVISYLDLTGGAKPHLLKQWSNGIGLTSCAKYAPSTKFYLRDERQGRLWKSKLPFPVHTVSRLIEKDEVASSTRTTKFRYHDGYFDGVEREFRGFGMAETWEFEEFMITRGKKKLKTPTCYTKMWYHTGAQEMGLSPSKSDTFDQSRLQSSIPGNLRHGEYQDAYRALKGKHLRSEVYGQDQSSAADIPYTVTETSYDVILVSTAKARQQPATFRVQLRESLSAHYERQKDEPCLEHEIVLETNPYGDVTKSMHIQHGMQNSPLSTAESHVAQQRHHITYTEISYTDAIDGREDVDNYYKPMLASTSLSHINDSPIPQVFHLNELRSKGLSAVRGTIHVGQQTRTYYASPNLLGRLPLGSFDAFSIVDQQFQLAMSSSMCDSLSSHKDIVFHKVAPQDTLFSSGGYVDLDGDKCAWIPSPNLLWEPGDNDGVLEYARKTFFTPKKSQDAFGNVSEVKMDEDNLLPVESIDAAQNIIMVENDYRVMQPVLVTDANKNRIKVIHDALGDTVALVHMGKIDTSVDDSVLADIGEDEADKPVDNSIEGIPLSLPESEILSFIIEPSHDAAVRLIGKADNRTLHCRARLTIPSSENILPTFRVDLARTEHVMTSGDHEDGQGDPGDILVNITYLTGRGAESQNLRLVDWNGAEKKWCVTEKSVHDANGNTVLDLKPYFSPTHFWQSHLELDYPFELYFLDALHRNVATLYPDHTWTKQCFSPWTSTSYDAGSTILMTDPRLDPDVRYHFTTLTTDLFLPSWQELRAQARDKPSQEAALKSAAYANTPCTTHFDSRGKAIEIAEQGTNRTRSIRSEYDVFGNRVAEFDALGRQVETNEFDVLGRLLASHNMDSGTLVAILDCASKPILETNSAGRQQRLVYDGLHRKTQTWVLDPKTKEEVLWSKIKYGEGLVEDESRNLRGRVFEIFDQSGLHRNVCYDFKGNCLSTEKHLALEYRSMLDWMGDVQLQEKPYTSSFMFDALNRAKAMTDAAGRSSRRTFDLMGGLRTLHSSKPTAASTQANEMLSCHVSNTVYAADGQPLQVDYGNSSHSAYTYDEQTRRLTRRRTWRDDGTVLEDLTTTYDCLGRVSSVVDAAQQTQFFRNQQIAPLKSYWYDDFGRLVRATGREMLDAGTNTSRSLRQVSSSTPLARQALPFSGESTEICNYVEVYTYDDAENILSLQHQSSDASVDGWTRHYYYNEPSLLEPSKSNNRLSHTKIGDLVEEYGYNDDAGRVGCITSMPGFSRLGWDCNNRLQCVARQKVNSGVPETTWYIYDEGGRRVRKVTDAAGTEGSKPQKSKETIFLDSLEIYQTYEGNGQTAKSITNTSLIRSMATEEGSPLVSIEDPVLLADKPGTTVAPLFRYHVSPNLETDEKAQVISYEEYSPFGVSMLLACKSDIEAPRRYRFAAYRRDSETGLYACGARYYAAWLGRWTSPDPLGTVDGYNVYAYVQNDPVNWVDPDGTTGTENHVDMESSGNVNATAEKLAKLHIARKKGVKKGRTSKQKVMNNIKNMTRKKAKSLAVKAIKSAVSEAAGAIGGPPLKFISEKAVDYVKGKFEKGPKAKKELKELTKMAELAINTARDDMESKIERQIKALDNDPTKSVAEKWEAFKALYSNKPDTDTVNEQLQGPAQPNNNDLPSTSTRSRGAGSSTTSEEVAKRKAAKSKTYKEHIERRFGKQTVFGKDIRSLKK